MTLNSVKILGHVQTLTNEPYVDFEKYEFENKRNWKAFYAKTFPQAHRPHSVDFSTQKVIILKTVKGQENLIGLLGVEKTPKKTLLVTVANISFTSISVFQTTFRASYLLLAVDKEKRVKVQEGDSGSRLRDFWQISDAAYVSNLNALDWSKKFKKLPLEVQRVKTQKDVNALSISDRKKTIWYEYSAAKIEDRELREELAQEEKNILKDLCGNNLKKRRYRKI